MHQYARLAGTGAGEHQNISLFPVIGYDALSGRGCFRDLDDGMP